MKKIKSSTIDNVNTIEDAKALLKEILKENGQLEEEVGRWKPKPGDHRYWISDTGNIQDSSVYDGMAESIYTHGNYFRDKTTAEIFAKKRAARNRLELLAYELNGQEVVEYRRGVSQYNIEFLSGDRVEVGSWENYYLGQVLFKTRGLAEKAIELTFNEDLITMFGVGK